MFCQNCGNKIESEEYIFCDQCGTKIREQKQEEILENNIDTNIVEETEPIDDESTKIKGGIEKFMAYRKNDNLQTIYKYVYIALIAITIIFFLINAANAADIPDIIEPIGEEQVKYPIRDNALVIILYPCTDNSGDFILNICNKSSNCRQMKFDI